MSKSMSNSKERKAVVIYHSNGDYLGVLTPAMDKKEALRLINEKLDEINCEPVSIESVETKNVITENNQPPTSVNKPLFGSVKVISQVKGLTGKMVYPVCFVFGDEIQQKVIDCRCDNCGLRHGVVEGSFCIRCGDGIMKAVDVKCREYKRAFDDRVLDNEYAKRHICKCSNADDLLRSLFDAGAFKAKTYNTLIKDLMTMGIIEDKFYCVCDKCGSFDIVKDGSKCQHCRVGEMIPDDGSKQRKTNK